jgi:hypothetical protein
MTKQLIISLLIGLMSNFVSAQKAESRLSLNSVSVGEEFTFSFELECAEKDNISYLPEKKSLIALRAKNQKEAPDTLKLEVLSPFKSKKENIQGKTYWRGDYSLICFDTGYLIIPPTKVLINGKLFEIPPALLRVNLVAKNKNIDLYDIEENFAIITEIGWLVWFKTVGLCLLLLASILILIYFTFFRGKKKESAEIPEQIFNSHEKTRKALNSLMKKQMWRKNLEKEHFTELSLIIREFLNEEYDNRFEGKTSFEIQLILRNEHFSSTQLNNLGLILNVSDMVKFAKSSVEEVGIQAIYQKAVEFVNETNKN